MKRTFLIALTLLLALPCLLIPVMAAEFGSDALSVSAGDFDGRLSILFDGIVFYKISDVVLFRENVVNGLDFYADGELADSISAVDLAQFWVDCDEGTLFLSGFLISVPADNFVFGEATFPEAGIWVIDPGALGINSITFVFQGSDLFTNEEPTPIPGPLANVTTALSSVLSWMKSVTTSLLSGELEPLLPLLVIPIAISLIFLAIKVIKMVFNF